MVGWEGVVKERKGDQEEVDLQSPGRSIPGIWWQNIPIPTTCLIRDKVHELSTSMRLDNRNVAEEELMFW